jgi:hypothetical protein
MSRRRQTDVSAPPPVRQAVPIIRAFLPEVDIRMADLPESAARWP